MNADEIAGLLEELNARLTAALKAQEEQLILLTQRYEAGLMNAVNELKQVAGSPAPVPKKEEDVPAAVWITAPTGEKMLVLNQHGVALITAVLNKTAELAQTLGKKAPMKLRR